MFINKNSLPQESEIVLCVVTKIQFTSVFVQLTEYDKQGMIHISEISPGRIRNLRDFVEEGKMIVCKVLRIDQQRGHIDLSLRRVSEAQRRAKVNWLKQEQMAEKIIEFVSKETHTDKNAITEMITSKIKEDYDSMYTAFQGVVENLISIDSLGLDEKISKKLEEIIRQRIKPQEVEIKGDLKMEIYTPNGVEIIKHALMSAEKTSDKIEIIYEGGGKYRFIVKANEYKEAEELLKKAYSAAISHVEKSGGTGEFIRAE